MNKDMMVRKDIIFLVGVVNKHICIILGQFICLTYVLVRAQHVMMILQQAGFIRLSSLMENLRWMWTSLQIYLNWST